MRKLTVIALASAALLLAALPATDDFERGAGSFPLGSNWTIYGIAGNPRALDGNLTIGDNDPPVMIKWSADVFPANHSSALTIYYPGDSSGLGGPGGRIQADRSGYGCMWNPAAGTVRAARYDAGTRTDLGLSAVTTTFTTSDVLRFEVSGTSISCWKNTTSLLSVTDSTYSTGSAGFVSEGYHNGLYSDWAGASLGGGSSPAPVIPRPIIWN